MEELIMPISTLFTCDKLILFGKHQMTYASHVKIVVSLRLTHLVRVVALLVQSTMNSFHRQWICFIDKCNDFLALYLSDNDVTVIYFMSYDGDSIITFSVVIYRPYRPTFLRF